MRFSMRWIGVCPAQKKRILPKDALCTHGVTKRRILILPHSQNALFREVLVASIVVVYERS